MPQNINTSTTDYSDHLSKPAQPLIHALIVAAGKGSRFGSKVAKQYTLINNKTILQHTVYALSKSNFIEKVVIVIADDDSIVPTLAFDLPCEFVIGGAERWESVQSGVNAIADAGAQEDDLVLIHDAARPCVFAEHIDAVITAAADSQYGAILGIPVSDTLKRVAYNSNETDDTLTCPTITSTVDRHQLWQAQTPQVFRLSALKEVLSAVASKGVLITDEAKAFEDRGYPIKIVKGSQQNLKLTYAEDLRLIEMILTSKK